MISRHTHLLMHLYVTSVQKNEKNETLIIQVLVGWSYSPGLAENCGCNCISIRTPVAVVAIVIGLGRPINYRDCISFRYEKCMATPAYRNDNGSPLISARWCPINAGNLIDRVWQLWCACQVFIELDGFPKLDCRHLQRHLYRSVAETINLISRLFTSISLSTPSNITD